MRIVENVMSQEIDRLDTGQELVISCRTILQWASVSGILHNRARWGNYLVLGSDVLGTGVCRFGRKNIAGLRLFEDDNSIT